MPKGHVEPREVICRACEQPFVTTKVGKAAQFCHRLECDASRELQHKAELESRRNARRAATEQRQRERQEEKVREREERKAQKKRDRAHAKRLKVIEKKMKRRRLEMFRPILEDTNQMRMVEDFLEVMALAGTLGADRGNLSEAVRSAVLAPGQKALHAAYQRIAAEALVLADQARPGRMVEEERQPQGAV